MASFFASLGRQQEPTEEDASTSTAASKDEDVKLPITGTRKDSTESLAKSYWSDDEADHSAANNNKPPMPDWLVEMVSKTVADVKLGLDKANEQFREMTTNSSKKPETVEGEATTEGGSKEEVNQVGPTLEATKTPTLTSRATTSSWQQQFEEARKKFLMDASIALMPPIVQKGLQLTKDTTYFPELEKDAQVRRGNELCSGEKEFREKRLLKVKKAIEDFIGEKIDHLDDVPVIAIGGSGGGCRAMTSSAGAFSKFKELGIMDMTTYLGGVSGTTWAMAACTANEFDFDRLRVRMGYVLSQNMMSFGMWMVRAWHEVLVSQPLVEKFGIPEDTLSLVDLWSSLIAGSLFGENEAIRKVVASKPQATEKPKEGSLAETVANTASLGNPADPDDPWMGKLALRKLSMQVQDGSQPMPIYQVVRDVILPVDKATLEQQKQKVVTEASANSPALLPTQVIKWLPYEFTPFEMGTTLQGGYYIPTWSFGRRFQNGTDLDKRPEVSFATILGVCSSAFTANVQAVFENFEESLPVGVKKQLESVLAEKGSMHVVEPARFCNPFWENREGEDVSLASGGGDVEGKVEEEVKKEEENKKEEAKKEEDEITGAKDISLMDAGMYDNLPFPALLHPSRQVDVIIALEHTRDPGLEQNLRFAESYAKEHGYGFPQLPDELPRSIFSADLVTRFKPQEGERAPELVYLPTIKTPNWIMDDFDPQSHPDASTFSFTIPWLSFELLYNCARRNVGKEESVEAIRGAVRDAYRRKRAARLAKSKVFGIF